MGNQWVGPQVSRGDRGPAPLTSSGWPAQRACSSTSLTTVFRQVGEPTTRECSDHDSSG